MTADEATVNLIRYLRDLGAGDVEPTTRLLDEGLIDSFRLLEIMDFLEQTYSVSIDPALVNPEEFASVETIVALLNRLRSEQNQAD